MATPTCFKSYATYTVNIIGGLNNVCQLTTSCSLENDILLLYLTEYELVTRKQERYDVNPATETSLIKTNIR